MWLYRDQSSLYPTSQWHILYSLPQTLLHPHLLCSVPFLIPSSTPSLSVSIFCVLLPLFEFIRTDTLSLLRPGFLFSNRTPLFSSTTVSGSQTRTYTPTYLWSPLSFSVFLPQNLFAPCMHATLLTVSLPLLSCHLYTVKHHSLSETAPHTVDVNWIQGHPSSLNYTD